MPSPLPIVIELAPPLSELCSAPGAAEFTGRLVGDARALLRELGLPGEPTVELRATPSSRAIRVRIHDRWLPFDPEFIKRAWQAVCPPALRAAADVVKPCGRRFPDLWLTTWFTESNGANNEIAAQIAFEFLHHFLAQFLKQCASRLVSTAVAAEFASTTTGTDASPERISSVEFALQALLSRGTTIRNKSLFLETLRFFQTQGRSVDDAIELAFARLRTKRIEIHLHPDYAKDIAPSLPTTEATPSNSSSLDPKLRDLPQLMENGLFYEFGLVLPQIVWVVSPAVRSGLIAVRVNDLLGSPIRGLEPAEMLVNADELQLPLQNFNPRPAVNPANGNPCAIVRGVERAQFEAAGLTVWEPIEFAVLFVASEIRRNAARLLDVEDTEYMLARLETVFPELIHFALSRFSVEDITRILRGILAKQRSIRNLRAILERIIQLDPIRADARLILFDDRYAQPSQSSGASVPNWRDALEFAESGLKSYLSYQLSRGRGTLPVLILDTALESRLDASASSPLTEAEQTSLLDQIWDNLTGVPASNPAIFTSNSSRLPLSQIVQPEFPNLPIVVYTDLSPSLSIQPFARLSLG